MPKEIVDLSGINGLTSQYYDGSFELKVLAKNGEMAGGFANPYKNIGVLTPAGSEYITVTGPSTGTIVATKADTVNKKSYFWDKAANLRSLSTFTDTSLSNRHTITSARGTDLEIYTVNDVERIFFSYRKAGGASDVGTFIETATYDDTWLSATAAGGFNLGENNHRMVVADNGFMYMLDGAAVHKIDGTSTGGAGGSTTPNVLLFPANFQLIDAIDTRGVMWIALMKSTRDLYSGVTTTSLFTEFVGVYLWDRQSTRVSMQDFIQISGVREIRAMFVFKGVPSCFTVSSRRLTQLRIYDGSEFKIMVELEAEAYPRFPDSIHVNGDLVTWVGNNGLQYAYGNPVPGMPAALYLIGDTRGEITAESTFQHSGAILGVGTTDEGYYINSIDGSVTPSNVSLWKPFLSTQNPLKGDVYSGITALPKLSTVNYMEIYFPKSGSGGTTKAMDLKIYFNQSTTAWATITLDRNDLARGWKHINVGLRNINFVQFECEWNPSSTTLTNIHPEYIEIDYDLITKNK